MSERKEPEWTIEAFRAGARWARMAGENAFDEALLNEDARLFAESGGSIRCRGSGTLLHLQQFTCPYCKTLLDRIDEAHDCE